MRDFSDIKADLAAPLDKAHVAERKGPGGKMLSYLPTWHVIDEANRIFDYDGWCSETEVLRVEKGPEGKFGNETWLVAAKVRVTVRSSEGIIWFHEGVGFGNGDYELAYKEAESDAKKRAFMNYGNPFGLPLYNPGDRRVIAQPAKALKKTDERVVYSAVRLLIDSCKTPEELNQCWKDNQGEYEKLNAGWRKHIVERYAERKKILAEGAREPGEDG